jgi:hypothetical protein
MEGIAVPAPVRTAETPSQASQSGGSPKNADSERIENLNIDNLEPTLPGLDFKLEFEKNNPNIDLDKNN